jgi:hypothetical protein
MVTEMSAKGYVLECAVYTKLPLPKNQHDYVFEFVGLRVYRSTAQSPPVPKVRCGHARHCNQFEIPLCLLPENHQNPDTYITGDELIHGPLGTRKRIQTTNVFARVMPEQPAIVNAPKANGDVGLRPEMGQ